MSPTWMTMTHARAVLVLLGACATAAPHDPAAVPAPPERAGRTDPVCAAITAVVPAARHRFESLLASIDPLYATTSEAKDESFVTGGPSTVSVRNATTTVNFDWVSGDWTARFLDAGAASYRRVATSAARCQVIAGWTREPGAANEAVWFVDRQYEMGPPRRIRLRVNRMLATDPLALEPKEDFLWLTITVSPAPL